MSIRWLTNVWDSSPYDGTKLLIHLGMADHANEEGWFFVSQTSLSKKARCSVEYVRKTVATMVEDGLLVIERKGHSKGKATEYRLQLPNTVGQTTISNSPTLNDQLPNSEPLTPQLRSATTVLFNLPDTTEVDAVASQANENDAKAIAKQSASEWWERQNPRPIGRAAWHSLIKVCEAAAERGYTIEQITNALDKIGCVPSIQQMDKQLRGVTPSSARQQRLQRGIDNIVQLQPQQLWEITR